MPRVALYCGLIGIGVAWGNAPTSAQTEPATAPVLSYVRGGARAMEERWGRGAGFGIGHPKVVATLETRPALGGETRPAPGGTWQARFADSDIQKTALAAVFGEHSAFAPSGLSPDSSATYFTDKAGIERTTIFEDKQPVADLWTIVAGSEDEATALVTALLRSYHDVVDRALAETRAKLPEFAAKIEERRPEITECEGQIQQAEDECRQLGAADMTDDAIDSAIARFEQERRLNQVDIAGLEASLSSAKQRAASGGDLAQTLARIQVELDIQLVGKLARKEALLREMRDLQAARAARGRMHGAQKKLAEIKKSIAAPETNLSSYEKWIQNLESLQANFTVTDNRVTLSPIAQTR